jgi:hypothetical protein
MVDLSLELQQGLCNLDITREPFFYPSKGSEGLQGSESSWFYVVTRGSVPGIYTDW